VFILASEYMCAIVLFMFSAATLYGLMSDDINTHTRGDSATAKVTDKRIVITVVTAVAVFM
jgi:hypothetical protein